MVKRWAFIMMLSGLFGVHSGLAGEETDRTGQGLAAARAWLEVVDAGDYDRSWDQSAELLQAVVSRAEWSRMLEQVLGALGPVMAREFRSASYSTALPGAPDGEYVVVEFSTTFANKKAAVETVTPVRGPDGSWRVAGYYIN